MPKRKYYFIKDDAIVGVTIVEDYKPVHAARLVRDVYYPGCTIAVHCPEENEGESHDFRYG